MRYALYIMGAGGEKWSVGEILEEVAKYPSRHIVVTGGEPFLATKIEETDRGD